MRKMTIRQQLISKLTPRGIGILGGNEMMNPDGTWKDVSGDLLVTSLLFNHGVEFVYDCIDKFGVTPIKG